jgi:transcriptional regulator with XRE-family HTH domain
MAKSKQKSPDLADQLRRALVASGMNLSQLANASGVHQAQLSRFLRAERSLTLPAVAKLCACLGLYLAGPGLDKKPHKRRAK